MLPTSKRGIVRPRDVEVRLRQLRCQRPACSCRTITNPQRTHCPLHPLDSEPALTLSTSPDFTITWECAKGCDQLRLTKALFGHVIIAWEKARWEGLWEAPPPQAPKDIQGVEVY